MDKRTRTHTRASALQHILLYSYINAHERAHKHTHTDAHANARTHASSHTHRAHTCTHIHNINAHTNKCTYAQAAAHRHRYKQAHTYMKQQDVTHVHGKRTPKDIRDTSLPRKQHGAKMRRQYQRLQHDKTGRLSRSRMCKRMHETC